VHLEPRIQLAESRRSPSSPSAKEVAKLSEMELRNLANEVAPLVLKGNCVAWIGSGLSRVAKYPEWDKTLDHLCDACNVPRLFREAAEDADRLIDTAEQCFQKDSLAYERTLANLFGHPPVEDRIAFRLLMKIPFKAYVTTNFDPLLSIACGDANGHSLHCYPDLPVMALGGSTPSVFYIHGLARRDGEACGTQLVLARGEFERAYDGIVGSFLLQFLAYCDVIFLGCRLSEPIMKEVFRRVHRIQLQIKESRGNPVMPRRQMLAPVRELEVPLGSGPTPTRRERDNEAEVKEDKRFQEMGIDVTRYQPADATRHWEVEQFLELLQDAVKRARLTMSEENIPREAP